MIEKIVAIGLHYFLLPVKNVQNCVVEPQNTKRLEKSRSGIIFQLIFVRNIVRWHHLADIFKKLHQDKNYENFAKAKLLLFLIVLFICIMILRKQRMLTKVYLLRVLICPILRKWLSSSTNQCFHLNVVEDS